jgi:hypothetical protein
MGRKDKALHRELPTLQLLKERHPLSSGRIFTAEWMPYVLGLPVERLRTESIVEVYWWALYSVPCYGSETEIGTV